MTSWTDLFNPIHSFNLTSADDPDPALLLFLQLAKHRAANVFLLKAVFQQDVWDFMAFPIRQTIEEAVFKCVVVVCWDVLKNKKNDNKNDNEDKETSLLFEKSDRLGPHDLLPA